MASKVGQGVGQGVGQERADLVDQQGGSREVYFIKSIMCEGSINRDSPNPQAMWGWVRTQISGPKRSASNTFLQSKD